MEHPLPNPSQPIINFAGEKVALGPLRRDLMPLYMKWVNDFEVTRTLAIGWRSFTQEAEIAWYEGAAALSSDTVAFVIYERATLRPIGNTNLLHIDHAERTAEFGIMIGEKDCWGKGYGTETARLMLDYGFNGLNLHNIMLRAASYNDRGLRAYLRAGFREMGRRRQAHWIGGRAYDSVHMDCLASEFVSPVLARLLPES
ncbi:MAG: GNAT family protein [Chloroflexi bacterium]|nr:GNAT family protein [Chloroflexota bacterium]